MKLFRSVPNNHLLPTILSILTLLITSLLITPISPIYAYLRTGISWPGNSANWQVQFLGSQFPSNQVNLVDSAASKWSRPSSGFVFNNWQNIITPASVQVKSIDFSAIGVSNFIPGETRLHTGGLPTADLYLNSTWSWNTTCTMNQALKIADFTVIVLHELGHVVGLNHDSSHPTAVMNPEYICKQNLTQDDLNGICGVYVAKGDLTDDAIVNVLDLTLLGAHWPPSGGYYSRVDLNFDGIINVTDVGIIGASWGRSC